MLIVGGHPVQSRAKLLQFANTVTMYSLRAGVRLNAAWLEFLYAGLLFIKLDCHLDQVSGANAWRDLTALRFVG